MKTVQCKVTIRCGKCGEYKATVFSRFAAGITSQFFGQCLCGHTTGIHVYEAEATEAIQRKPQPKGEPAK